MADEKRHSGVIFARNSKGEIPSELVGEIVSKNNDCGSVTFPVSEAKEVIVTRIKEKVAPKTYETALSHTVATGKPMVCWAGHSPVGFHDDDVQPMVLLTLGKNSDGKDRLIAVAYVEGNFDKFYEENSKHSAEWLFVQKKLRPRVEKMWKLSAGDFNKLDEHVRVTDEDFFDDETDGNIVIILGNGNVHRFSKPGDAYRETSFGFTTEAYDWYEDPNKVETKPEEQSFFSSVVETVRSVVTNTKTPDAPKTETAVKPTGLKTKKGVDIPPGMKVVYYVMMKCPKSEQKKAGIKAFYENATLTGVAPKGWDKKPLAECKPPENWTGEILERLVPVALGEAGTYKSFQEATKPGDAPAPDQTQSTETEEETMPNAAAAEAGEEPGQQTQDYIWPFPEKEEQEAVVSMIAKFQDENKNYILNPRTMSEWEERRSTFSEAMALGEEPLINITPEFIEDLATNHATAHLMWSLDMWAGFVLALEEIKQLKAKQSPPSSTGRTITRKAG